MKPIKHPDIQKVRDVLDHALPKSHAADLELKDIKHDPAQKNYLATFCCGQICIMAHLKEAWIEACDGSAQEKIYGQVIGELNRVASVID